MTTVEQSAAAVSEDGRPAPFMSPKAVRAMSVAVVVMGVILLVGFATLVGLIIYRSSNAVQSERASAISNPHEIRRLYTARDKILYTEGYIPKGARIVGTAVDGDRVFLTIEDGGGSSLMLFDAKTWKVIGVARFAAPAGP